jgi:DNA-damage-inducible protein J
MMHYENPKDTAIRIRINQKTKSSAENILRSMGMTMSQAITIYLVQIIANRSIPFNIEAPNKETVKVIKEARAGKGLIRSKNINALFDELGI